MIRRVSFVVFFALVLLALSVLAQGPRGGQAPAVDIPAPNVTFDRILKANQEPQNWLTYSGTPMSQRYSMLTEITPSNAKDLELKWVFQSRSLEKHEVTPLVVNGIMYTVQGINDVIALDAKTGKQLWRFPYTPDPAAKNCCGKFSRGLAILGDKLFLATFDAHMIAIDARTGRQIWNSSSLADPKLGYAF